MKKWIAIAAAVVMMTGVCAISASASGLNSYEEALIEKLSQSVEIDGKTASLPASYVNQAKAYFVSSVDLTKEQADEINGYVDEGIALVKAQTTTDLKKFPASVNSKLLELSKKATEVVGLKLTYDGKVINIVDEDGKVAFSGQPAIKTTGVDVNLAVGLGALVLVAAMLGTSVVAAKKLKLFSK